ncbi:hypothetical protein L596_003318 [Steinernema carpocapsae]|uniref:Endonuclease/exonuclease/phosphatase domain-containing protein n=1 Tax=Steinernema carpocapsae TaxID=34508 RepID=A0A4U8UTR9_STECR|nr:hypothetical protein L596_003318 [Steinernema carpocapsae]
MPVLVFEGPSMKKANGKTKGMVVGSDGVPLPSPENVARITVDGDIRIACCTWNINNKGIECVEYLAKMLAITASDQQADLIAIALQELPTFEP